MEPWQLAPEHEAEGCEEVVSVVDGSFVDDVSLMTLWGVELARQSVESEHWGSLGAVVDGSVVSGMGEGVIEAGEPMSQ